MRAKWSHILVPLYLLMLAGCGDDAVHMPPSASEATPVPVPFPSLAGVLPRVAEQIGRARNALEQAQRGGADSVSLARAYGGLGQLYHTYGLPEAAQACYLNARQLAPDEFRWHYYLGQVHRSRGEMEQAAVELDAALELRPDYAPAAVSLAQVLRDLGRTEKALGHLKHILKEDPQNAVANFVAGQLFADLGDHAGSLPHFKAALAAQPNANRARFALANAYRAAGERQRAEEQLALRGDGRLKLADPLMEELTRLDLGAGIELEAGREAFARKDYRGAAAHFEKALEAEPKRAETHQALASALVKTGDAEGAESHYREALQIEPGFVAAHYNLAQLLGFQGRREEAIGHYEEVLRREPGYRIARTRLAGDLLREDRYEEALTHIEIAIEAQQDAGALLVLKAHCLTMLGRHAEALTLLETAHERLPVDPKIAEGLARLLAASPNEALRDGERALPMVQNLLARRKTLDRVEILAMTLAESGAPEKAVQVQRDAIAAAARAGRKDLAAGLADNLARYKQGRPAPAPWSDVSAD